MKEKYNPVLKETYDSSRRNIFSGMMTNKDIFGSGSGDWLEDAQYPNGKYTCKCSICGQTFLGHKRRVVCKVCAEEEITVNKERWKELLDIEDKYNKLNDWYWSRPK